MKNLKIWDWISILIALNALVFAIVLKCSFSYRIFFIAMTIVPLLNFIKNKTYNIIVTVICFAMIAYSVITVYFKLGM